MLDVGAYCLEMVWKQHLLLVSKSMPSACSPNHVFPCAACNITPASQEPNIVAVPGLPWQFTCKARTILATCMLEVSVQSINGHEGPGTLNRSLFLSLGRTSDSYEGPILMASQYQGGSYSKVEPTSSKVRNRVERLTHYKLPLYPNLHSLDANSW